MALFSMKKETDKFGKQIDHVFWFLVTIFPLLLYALYVFRNGNGSDYLTFSEFLSIKTGLSWLAANPVYNVFEKIFGNNGFFPMFSENSGYLILFGYVASVEVLHVLFDVVVFIPRFCHTLVGRFTQND